MKLFTAAPFYTLLHLPKFATTKLFSSSSFWQKRRSRSRGVAKGSCCTPMLHGDRFFFWLPCSVGMRFAIFATPPTRECDFFNFCRTSQARSSIFMKMSFSDPWIGVALQTMRNRKRSRIDTSPANSWKWLFFYITKIKTSLIKNTHISNDSLTIPKIMLY